MLGCACCIVLADPPDFFFLAGLASLARLQSIANYWMPRLAKPITTCVPQRLPFAKENPWNPRSSLFLPWMS
jgi:hypothetical protein